ncbi:MAG: ABC transporter ATP-binding protein [Egibacteraceae bacterium]
MAVVEVRDLHKRFAGGVVAVDGVDLATAEGEYLVLLGPSGCGKTTLLRMIAGLEQPTSGEVYIGGSPMTGLPPRARQIAMVFQSYALYPHKTVLGNIVFPLKAAGMGQAERRRKAEWAAGLLGIGHLLDRRPRHLSGGERQRVALARALVREPSVFLLDEPLSNLDAKLRASAREDLRQFQERIGVTTIYVTHDQVEAMALGHRIAVMSEGKVRQVGTPQEVYREPIDTFVATFLGSPPMNLLEHHDRLMGFRPEHLLPKGVPEPADDDLDLDLHVQRVEHLGSERHVIGTMGAARVIAVLPSTVTAPVHSGQTQAFTVASRDLRFFTKSGKRIARQRL